MDADFRAQLQRSLGSTYTLERELGGGGMSRVFVATETAIDRAVVLKILPPELAAGVNIDRFRREIQLAGKLNHPHIVPILASGVADGLPYYTMPLVEGESLRTRLTREGALPLPDVLDYLRGVLSALAYAHGHDVVHRDIKPDNVLLAGEFAVVTDFGVAKALSTSGATGGGLTSVGLVLGTPAYMAPEQVAADPHVDHRADLYALGAMTYEMLTGQPPFAARTPQAILAAQIAETPDPIERRRASVPPALSQLVMRLLAKSPADRPQSAQSVLREIDAMGAGGEIALTPARAVPARATWRPPRSVLATAVLIALAVAGALVVRGRPLDHASAVGAPGTAQASIAVLPFVNMSGEKDSEFFSDGMTEELIDRLASIRGLRVAARTSAFAFKGKDVDVREIGRQLHVHSVVEGSVRRMGSRIRVTAQLIDADSGFHRWSDTYDGDLRDVFAVQQQIGTAIAAQLRITLVGRDSALLARTPTLDTAAHTLYLQGRFFWNKRTGDALRRAAALFRQAAAHDPAYAEAYSGLAETYVLFPAYLDVAEGPALDSAEQMAWKALSLDSALSGPHAALGMVSTFRFHREAAKEEYDHAIALRPNYATAHHWKGYPLLALQQPAGALTELRIAQQLDPLSLVIRQDVALDLVFMREFSSAESEIRRVIDLDPSYAYGWLILGEALAYQSKSDSAIAAFRRGIALSGTEPYAGDVALMAVAFARAGRADSALALLRTLERQARARYVSPAAMGLIALNLGDRDRAVRLIGRAIDAHDSFVVCYFPLDPGFDSLRADPRFTDLKRRMNLR